MTAYSLDAARPLGKGQYCPVGSVTDPELATLLSRYKRTVSRRYRSLSPEEMQTGMSRGTLHISPKVDGELWFIISDGDETFMASHTGRVILGGVPVLTEAHKVISPRVSGRTILAGELFAAVKKGRPRVGDLGSAMGGEKQEVNRLGFQVFDLVAGGDAEQPEPPEAFPERLEVMRRLVKGGKRVQVIRNEVGKVDQAIAFFAEWVESGKAEGLVVRTDDERIYKIKPFMTIDAAVIGFTERADFENQARSLLLALLREDGQFQLIGSVGNLGKEDRREAIYDQLRETVVDSRFRFASSTGALYRFVRPEMVAEVRLTDLQVEDSSCKTINKMVLDFGDDGWSPRHPLPGVSLLHPVLVRVRDDKQVTLDDVSTAQVLDRCQLEALDAHAEAVDVPASSPIRREVYTKAAKDKMTVRKLLVWKTNKETISDDWPAYVVHFTDYSPNRKDPLKREVRLCPTEEIAMEIAEDMLKANIKRGWKQQ